MRTNRTQAEIVQIKDVIQKHETFYRVFSDDWTKNVMDNLHYNLYGKIPRNFLVNIGGLIGSKTGVFKSTLGLQMAIKLDKLFTLKKRVAFSINDLLDKVNKNSEYSLCNLCYHSFIKTYNGSYETHEHKNGNKCDNCDNVADKLVLLTKLLFFLDEQTKTLKTGGLIRLQNLVDTCRQRQICFITCGVEGYNMHFTTYELQRVQESHDDYLPKKRVRYAVYDKERDIYYGYFQWDITPLSDPKWKAFFDEYSVMKTDFQRVAIAQQTQSMAFEEYAQVIIDSEDFNKCFKVTRSGKKVLITTLVNNLVVKKYPDLTNQERMNIISEIKFMTMDENDDEGDEY